MSDSLKIVFVCLGNICRSPMAERIAEKHAGDRPVRFSSVGITNENDGFGMDERAMARLTTSGYRSDDHISRQVTEAELDADLLIAMEPRHLVHLRRLGAHDDQLALLTDFDPNAEPGSGVVDPWYGSAEGFDATLASIEAAMPGVLAHVDQLLDRRAGTAADSPAQQD